MASDCGGRAGLRAVPFDTPWPRGDSAGMEGGPFCDVDSGRVILHDDAVVALWDALPVSDGHALIVPRRHVPSWFDATPQEQQSLTGAIQHVREAIEERRIPDGYNIGINVDPAGGQTVPHLHLHVIPRYEGDVDDPRGGVRWVIPERAAYWTRDESGDR